MAITLPALHAFLGLGALLQAPTEPGRLALVGGAAWVAAGGAAAAVWLGLGPGRSDRDATTPRAGVLAA